MWDTWMLFDRAGVWNDVPGGLLSWGYPIMPTRGQLQEELDSLFGTRPRRLIPAAAPAR